MSGSPQPTGTVTFLFSDIQGSTRLWEEYPDQMRVSLERHDELLQGAVHRNSGYTFKTVGDAFCVAFQRAQDAVSAALEIHDRLGHQVFDLPRPIRVRIGIHTGEAQERAGDYYGPVVNRVARLEAAAHGGQTVMSQVTYELVRDHLRSQVQYVDLGDHRLKDLIRSERVFQVVRLDSNEQYPALRSLDEYPNNLPSQTTPIIGRDAQIDTVRCLLVEERERLVTLIGPGGIGKTRTALQIGADLIEAFSNGVFFADLSTAHDELDIVRQISRVFDLGRDPQLPEKDTLKEYLARKEMLLILDNFEQVVVAATLVRELLESAPRLSIVATSRIVLNVRGERIVEIPPLRAPERSELDQSLESLSHYDAVVLFVSRAEAIDPAFAVSRENIAEIAEICLRLDGIPLAIELATARLRILDTTQLLNRLGSRLRILTGGAADLPERQRTLRSTIDWSYDLLPPDLKCAFLALASFRGIIRLPAAERVISAVCGPELDPLDLVQALVSQSLLAAVPLADEHSTFAMLQTIHEYAEEQLDGSDVATAARDAHAEVFCKLAERVDATFWGPEQPRWMRLAWSEEQNLEAAIEHRVRNDRVEDALSTALDLCQMYLAKRRGDTFLDLVEQTAFSDKSVPLYARMLISKADALLASHRLDEASLVLESLRSLPDSALDSDSQSDGLYLNATLLALKGEFDAARRIYEDVLRSTNGGSRPVLSAKAVHGMAHSAASAGNVQESVEHFDRAIVMFGALGDRRSTAEARANRAIVRYLLGDLVEAISDFEIAAQELSAAGDTVSSLTVYGNLGFALIEQKNPDRARSVFESLDSMAYRQPIPELQARAQAGLAECAVHADDIRRAGDHADRAIAISSNTNDPLAIGAAHRIKAEIQALSGDFPAALASFETARAQAVLIGDPRELERIDQGVVDSRTALATTLTGGENESTE